MLLPTAVAVGTPAKPRTPAVLLIAPASPTPLYPPLPYTYPRHPGDGPVHHLDDVIRVNGGIEAGPTWNDNTTHTSTQHGTVQHSDKQ